MYYGSVIILGSVGGFFKINTIIFFKVYSLEVFFIC